MARISGINIPLNKRVEIGLTYIFGIGRSQARTVLKSAGVDPDTYVKDIWPELCRYRTREVGREISERITRRANFCAVAKPGSAGR